ncbi:hypothetical protein G8759_18275 [Spirosoma aureum]|uniref:Clan AA aspartic protease n=1 Tax=Spirosoma aureum TaxID=2692134 RepID=A0A6G9APM8_9BACT|nr:retropepsin-like aspartic protease [Spirosoma aureum]QIP14427.1 hypothetical protein G8759_18275 [Spirosoma aureum]
MCTLKLYVLFLCTVLCQSIFGQEIKQRTESARNYELPFQLTESNNLSVQAILNEIDTINLMVHTAANSVTLTEEAIQKLKSLKFAGTDSVKSWGGGGNSSRFSNGNTLQIGELKWEDVSIWENKNSGPKTDGKFGIDLFANKIIEIDFEKKLLTLYNSLPAKAATFEKLNLTNENGNLFLVAGCEIGGQLFRNKFLLHSGYSGTILLDDKFTDESKIDEKVKIIAEKELKDSFGNLLKTKRGILPSFSIGSVKLSNVPVGFFKGAIGRQKMSIIGGDLLKRFTLLIDSQAGSIYLKRNNLAKVEYANS